jgi:hypothetical protein
LIKVKSFWGVLLVFACALAVCCPEARAEETKRVIAGRPQYDKGSSHRFTFGTGYRKEWTTPIDVPVLDLKTFGGGLTPTRQVGSMQSLGLALRGPDGKSYTFRTFDKDPTKILPEDWRGSVPAYLFQDQTTASHPGAALVVPVLAEAAGIPHTNPIAVYMPDDPALGEFRATFGGKPGMIDEYPLPASGDRPGYHGATEIIPTEELWKRWLAGEAIVDTHALLRCRVFDAFLGDWDRHHGQWRWMKLPGRDELVPLPEDRDQAFSNYSGVMLSMARRTVPRLIPWSDDYQNMDGLLYQGRETDDWLLIGQQREAFVETARELQKALGDEVIEAAMKRLPPEWHRIRGDALVRDLKKRRDLLVRGAEAFYEALARHVDVKGTNRDDVARLTREQDGSATLELSLAGKDGAPGRTYLRRRFSPKETREVRIFLYDGDDRFSSTGPKGGVTVRLSSGAGRDQLDDSKSGGVRFYDVETPSEVVRGPGTSASGRAWTPIYRFKDTPWINKQDFGSLTGVAPLLWWEPDPGIVLAAVATRVKYGFRKEPYKSMQSAMFEFKTKRGAFAASYAADVRWNAPGFATLVETSVDGAKNYNFYGFGNETTGEEDEFTEADQQLGELFTSMVAYENKRRTLFVALGPDMRYAKSRAAADTLIGTTQPYGFGDFGEIGVRARVQGDTRGRSLAAGIAALSPGGKVDFTGLTFSADLRSYPKAWDVTETFTSAEASATGYWQATDDLVLSGRIGGQKVWGSYPWFESAFIGGSDTVRGYGRNRYAGDASAYANAQMNLGLFNLNLILPLRVGILGLADVGRVWVSGESSKKWHPAYGGGIFVRVLTTRIAFHGILAHSADGSHFYVNIGLGI